MSSLPLVSIIIRSINRTELLKKALDSVASQTWPNIEIILVAAIPKHEVPPSHWQNLPIVYLPTDAQLHRCDAANRGLEKAKGEFVLLLDDDDGLYPNHIQKLINALKKNGQAKVAYSDYEQKLTDGTVIANSSKFHWDPILLKSGNWMPPCSVLFRRELIDDGLRFDLGLDLFEDWDFWLQAQQYGDFIHAPGISAWYLIHNSSGIHQTEPFFSKHHQIIYQKWLPKLSATETSALMQRIWMQTDDQFHRELLLNELQKKNQQLEKNYKDILNSNSFRITAPLRKLSAHVKKISYIFYKCKDLLINPSRLKRSFQSIWGGFNQTTLNNIRAKIKALAAAEQPNYTQWIDDNEVSPQQYETLIRLAEKWQHQPLVSVVMPTYNPNLDDLKAAILSVQSQLYSNWELCIADDASNTSASIEYLKKIAAEDDRIQVTFRPQNGHISAASNSALSLAKGQYIALLDQDDLLHPTALWCCVETLQKFPDAGLIYSDEDKINLKGQRCDPYFKCEYNPELMLTQNMVSHLGFYRHDLIKKIGGFRLGLEGSQDYDLALRVIEQLSPNEIIHIPRVLYHWRMSENSTAMNGDAKPYAQIAFAKSIQEHLARTHRGGQVMANPDVSAHFRVQFDCPEPQPLVSILIPTKDKPQLLRTCIHSIQSKSSYTNYEIIIIDNNSCEPETLQLFETYQQQGIQIHHEPGDFNYSLFNNHAALKARGEFLCLMNNDIEVITKDWLEELISFASQEGIGAVGARLWYPNQTLQHAGVIIGLRGTAGHAHYNLPKGQPGYFGRAVLHQSISAVTGACLLVRKSIYHQVRGLDEELSVAYNDVDFCLKIQAAGYRNIWTPHAELIHHESASRGQENTPEKQKRFNQEVELIKQRWHHIIQNDPAYSPNLTLDNSDFSMTKYSRTPQLA